MASSTAWTAAPSRKSGETGPAGEHAAFPGGVVSRVGLVGQRPFASVQLDPLVVAAAGDELAGLEHALRAAGELRQEGGVLVGIRHSPGSIASDRLPLAGNAREIANPPAHQLDDEAFD